MPLGPSGDLNAMTRAQSAHQLGLRHVPTSSSTLPLGASASGASFGGGPDENAPAPSGSMSALPPRSQRMRGYTDQKSGKVIHPFIFRDALGPRVSTPNVDQTDKTRLGAVAGRLTSEDYGLYFEDGEPGGPGPGVRERYCPGVRKPLMYPSEREMMARSRPKPTTTMVKTSRNQEYTLTHGLRSSALIGAGARPKTAGELKRTKTAAEYNYDAQFIWTDPAMPPVGGLRRRSTSADILEAVAWQQQFVEQAARCDSWEARLDEKYSSHKVGQNPREPNRPSYDVSCAEHTKRPS